jgi:hypothetical protein
MNEIIVDQTETQPKHQCPAMLSDLQAAEGKVSAQTDPVQISMSEVQPAMTTAIDDTRVQSLKLKQLIDIPMESWSSAQLVEWAKLQNLPELDSVQSIFMGDEIDGEEFVELKPKMLRRMLKKAGAADPEYSAQVILAQRVDTRNHQRDRSEAMVACRSTSSVGENQVQQTERTATVKSVECPFCFEPYCASDEMLTPRILTKCGHTAWCDAR